MAVKMALATLGKKPAKRKPKMPKPLLTPDEVITALRALYGEPEWRPHGDAMASWC